MSEHVILEIVFDRNILSRYKHKAHTEQDIHQHILPQHSQRSKSSLSSKKYP